MRNFLIFAMSMAGLWTAVPALASPSHPLFNMSMRRDTYVGKPKPLHPWQLVDVREKTRFDQMQDNLKTLDEFRKALRIKARTAGHEKVEDIGGGSLGHVGGIGIVGSRGEPDAESVEDRLAQITPEEAKAAIEDFDARKKHKTLRDILKPQKEKDRMLALEVQFFNQGHQDGSRFGGGIGGIGIGSAPVKIPETGTTAAPSKTTAPPGGTIGHVGGIGKVGPNQ